MYDVSEYAEPPEDDMPIPKFSAPAAVAPNPDLRDEVTALTWSPANPRLLYAAHASGGWEQPVFVGTGGQEAPDRATCFGCCAPVQVACDAGSCTWTATRVVKRGAQQHRQQQPQMMMIHDDP